MTNRPCSLKGCSLKAVCLVTLACASSLGCAAEVECHARENQEIVSSFQGIYAVNSATQNQESCELEGEAVSVPDYLYLVEMDYKKAQLLRADSCADLSTCRDSMARGLSQPAVLGEAGLDFVYVSDHDTVFGDLRQVDPNATPGLCEGRRVVTVLTRDGEGIRIEARTVLAQYAPNAEGLCDPDQGDEALLASSCSQLDVITASFSESL